MARHKILRAITPRFVWPSRIMRRPIRRATAGRVMAGPFAGLRYVEEAVGASYLPKLLGTYEMELHEAIEAIVAAQPRRVVDVGAAEGYYAVGLAKRMPGTTVVSFEQNPTGRELHRRLVELNGVAAQSDIRGECTPETLAQCLAEAEEPVAIICDVEGYEGVLMDPEAIPALRRATILIELHDVFQPGLSELLRKRFEASHDISDIVTRPRRLADYPFEAWWQRVLPHEYALYPLDELRPGPMRWFWMRPRQTG